MIRLLELQSFLFICLFAIGSHAYAQKTFAELDNESYETSPYEKWIWKGFLWHVGDYEKFLHYNDRDNITQYITETFGSPIKISKTRKQHWSSPDFFYEYVTRNYEGLTILSRLNPMIDKPIPEIILKITLTNPKYKLMHGLRIGDPVKKYLSTLGDKRPITGYKINYFAQTGEGQGIEATLFINKGKKVTKIIWDYTDHYTD